MKDAHRATLQSSFALAHDDSSPSQGEPKQCRRPKATAECTLPNASPSQGEPKQCRRPKAPTECTLPNASPSQGEPRRCRRPKAPTECTLPNASPCLRGGGTSGEAASDGRVRREKRRKGQRGKTNKENTRPRVWAHSLNDTQPQKGSFCAVPRQKCSKDFLQCLLVRHKNLLF